MAYPCLDFATKSVSIGVGGEEWGIQPKEGGVFPIFSLLHQFGHGVLAAVLWMARCFNPG